MKFSVALRPELYELQHCMASSLAWPDPIFVQGHYRFQYKRPAQKTVWKSLQGSLGFHAYECVDYSS